MKPGHLISFEGIDGSGKSLHALELYRNLLAQNFKCVLTSEPTNSPAGRFLRSTTVSPSPYAENILFQEDRLDHVETTILPNLRHGITVICDRYFHSSAAYQGSKGLDPSLIIKENLKFAPVPSLTILLDIPIDLALERISKRGPKSNTLKYSSYEKRESLSLIRSIYLSLTDQYIRVVDSSRPVEEVSREIFGYALSLFDGESTTA